MTSQPTTDPRQGSPIYQQIPSYEREKMLKAIQYEKQYNSRLIQLESKLYFIT